MTRYESLTSKRIVNNCCQNTEQMGVFGTDFDFSCMVYNTKFNNCDCACESLNVDTLANDFISSYVGPDNKITCPTVNNGLLITENVKVVDKGCLKMTLIVWYKVCNKNYYDIYYTESNYVRCPPEPAPSLNLSFYDTVCQYYAEDCYETQKRALMIATQLLC
jgi:hypothetical protein